MALFYDDPKIIDSLLENRKIPLPSKGDNFTRLTFTGRFFCYLGPPSDGNRPRLAVECLCVCGKLHIVCLISLLRGASKSCGCLRDEAVARTGRGKATYPPHILPFRKRLYDIWRGMMERCYDPAYKNWDRYGGRGISVCEEWHVFRCFILWGGNNGYIPSLSLDRFPDNNGNYQPTNVRWANQEQQCRNKENNIILTAWGESKCIGEWADDTRCKAMPGTLYARIRHGWPPERAISEPAWNRGQLPRPLKSPYQQSQERIAAQ